MSKYKRTGNGITKDGEKMFHCDIVQELKTKDLKIRELEKLLKEQEEYHQQCLKDWLTSNDEYEKQLAKSMKIVESVAHIGIDFGYGEYYIDNYAIAKARQLLQEKAKL